MVSAQQNSEREIFTAFVSDAETMGMLQPLTIAHGWTANRVFSGGIAAAVRSLGAMPCPHILLVDLSESQHPDSDVADLADVCDEDTIVLAIGSVNDVSLYRNLINIGVHDYLVKPFAADILEAALLSAKEAMLSTDEEEEDQTPSGNARTILFTGVRGGIGASTMAANIAWLKANSGRNTALLDLDFHYGSSAMQFDLEPGRGLLDVMETPERVDGLFLDRAVVKPNENLSILCTEAALGHVPQPTEGALNQLLSVMAETYRNVIVDIPRHIVAEHPDILTAATDIVIVTDLSLLAARDCIRLKAFIKNHAPAINLHIVVNKFGAVTAEVREKDFENSIEQTFDAKIQFDTKAALLASEKGVVASECASSSKLTAGMKAVDSILTTNTDATADSAQKGSWLGGFMKKSDKKK